LENTGSGSMTVLKVDNLRKEFGGIVALDALSFTLEKGTITGLIGPNGAGKTTAFNVLTGFCRPDEGSAHFNGTGITDLPPFKIARLGIGRTFQNIRIFPQITVLENLMLAPRGQKGENILPALFRPQQVETDEKRAGEEASRHLETVGLVDKKDELAENLSHGQRKLLELARALATGSQLLLLDEPTAGVFPETRNKILDLLQALRKAGKTILFIEHDMNVVTRISDTVIVLNYGRKIAEGPPEKIKSNKEVVEAYLGRSNATT